MEEGDELALALVPLLLLLHVKQCQQFNTAKRPRNFSNSLDNEKRDDEVTLNQSPQWRQLSAACGRADRDRQLGIVSRLSNKRVSRRSGQVFDACRLGLWLHQLAGAVINYAGEITSFILINCLQIEQVSHVTKYF